jgi:predicted DNA-binding transcriptional regulator AlpA
MTTAPRTRDPLLLTVPEAAALCGMNRRTFHRLLKKNPELVKAISVGISGERWISRPKLLAWAGDPR